MKCDMKGCRHLCDNYDCWMYKSKEDFICPVKKHIEQSYGPTITKEQSYIDVLRVESLTDCDTEENHMQADQILCQLLIELGYKDIVEVYNLIEKWYT